MDRVERIESRASRQLDEADRILVLTIRADVARLRGANDTALRFAEEAVKLDPGLRTSAHMRAVIQVVDCLMAVDRDREALRTANAAIETLLERGLITDAALLLERCALLIARDGEGVRAAQMFACMEETLRRSQRVGLRFDREIEAKLQDEISMRVSPEAIVAAFAAGRRLGITGATSLTNATNRPRKLAGKLGFLKKRGDAF